MLIFINLELIEIKKTLILSYVLFRVKMLIEAYYN